MDDFLFYGIICLLAFLISVLTDKRRLWNGILLTASVLFLLLGLTGIILTGPINQLDQLILFSLIILAGTIPLVLITMAVYLIKNARDLVQKEGRRMSNLLSLCLSVAVFLFLIVVALTIYTVEPLWIMITLYAGFYGFLFVSYLVSSFLYRYNVPSLNKDYILVLGAGLIKGKEVSPLLASRLDRARYFYELQKKIAPPPKIVVTGGRGADELISEALAMKEYLLNQEIPEHQIVLEEKATNTKENFQFSKELFDYPNASSVFVTNHFHLFRASLYARQAGIGADGIGSPTRWYYLPNAYTREFLALIAMYKRIHLALFIAYMIVVAFLL